MTGSIDHRPAGTLPDGSAVTCWRLSQGGVSAEILTYGGILHRLEVPGRDGRAANVVLGRPDLAAYVAKSAHFGALTGRYANRIAGGRFDLDGRTYRLACNDGPNHLHGGPNGFDKRVWAASEAGGADGPAVRLAYASADGEEGFPGRVEVEVVYGLVGGDSLRLDYRAVTDAPTILNLTNHSYFNLAGEDAPDIYDHELSVAAGRYLPTDAHGIPLGDPAPLDGTPLDFRTATRIGARIRAGHEQILRAGGYDHCYLLDAPGLDRPAVRVRDPASGRVMSVATTQPAVQVYTANKLDGTIGGTSGVSYRQGAAVCFETQHFPDSPNRPAYPSTVLRPGELFESATLFRFTAE